MWQSQFAVYLGQENEAGFFGFIVAPSDSERENNFFLVLEAKTGLDKESGRQTLSAIKEKLLSWKINSLVDLEEFIAHQIKEENLPTGISLAAGYITDRVIYLKTVGEGKVFIKRGANFEKIIDGDKTASGYLKEGDFFIFTTNRFLQLFGEEKELKKVFDHKTPHQIIEDLSLQVKVSDDQGAIALFVKLNAEEDLLDEEKTEKSIVSQPMVLERGRSFINNLYQKWQQSRLTDDKKKTFTVIIAFILILVLFWSVGLGLTRRQESELNKKINRSQELITQKLEQAEEVAFFNLGRSQALIKEAQEELANLKKTVGSKKEDKIKEIEKMIKSQENKILKKEEKEGKEFFDLTIDNEKAEGDILYLDKENLIILDRKQGNIYRVSLLKKSIDKISHSQIKLAQLIAGYQEKIFFLVNGEGIYQVTGESKPKIIIKDDENSLGKIIDLWVYNGNIYLLDTEKDEIDKYLAAEDGYGSKSNYFKPGQGVDLSEANSLAIDGSIYIGFKDYLIKYTAGVGDDFKTSFPEKNININKIYTSKDLEKVYAWDKKKGVIYILSKNGSYERQIKSSILLKGTDLVVFENAAYVVIGEKIYQISLE